MAVMRKGGVLLVSYPIVNLLRLWWIVLLKMIGGFTGGVAILDSSWRYNINS